MKAWLEALLDPAVWRLAVRDGRRSAPRLLASALALAIGLAALVAISSFAVRLDEALDAESQNLLGADLRVESTRPYPEEVETALAGEWEERFVVDRAQRISFLSMVRCAGNERTALVRIRAIEGAYPFYGELETIPAAAARAYAEQGGALVDISALEQLEAAVGDRLLVGDREVPIVGELHRIPGESPRQSWFGPRVYLPVAMLDPALLGKGSRISFDSFFRLRPGIDPERAADSLDELARDHDLRVRTAADLRRSWGRFADNTEGFLSLVAFVALLLGGLGIASAVHVHVLHKRPTVALLRCLGVPGPHAMVVLLLQTLALGLVGTLGGLMLGALCQAALPGLLADFLPVEVPSSPVFGAMLVAAAFGFLTTVIFALLPLIPLRHVSALMALRRVGLPAAWRDPVALGLALTLLAVITAFALGSVRRDSWALGFVGGLLSVLVLLAVTSRALIALLRRALPSRWPYPLRQGLANLHRPANQTTMLLLCTGLGSFLLCTLAGSRQQLVSGLRAEAGAGRANLVFFDVQDSQLGRVEEILTEQDIAVLESVPVVSMRLRTIGGRSVEEIRRDPNRNQSTWPLLRTYRSTYRDSLTEGERLLDGRFPTERVESLDEAVPITLEEGIARRLRVGVGSRIEFDVQGLVVRTEVCGLREVDWGQARPNFYAVFPPGALELAPQFHVLLTRSHDPAHAASAQRAVLDEAPTVSAVDVEHLLQIVDEVLGQVRFVVQFMAAFSLATGVVVVLGSLWSSRRHRVEEGVLLRTLGASRGQVRAVLLSEWTLLGFVGGLAGSLLAQGAVAALGIWVFEEPPAFQGWIVLIVPLVTAATAATVGWWAGRGATARPPLEVLRASQTA